ncbi:MAG: Tim44-like domain-containing protein [Legionella sp.]|nr:Tim44-like domain-containing protein [Legionella sp.]
MRNIVSVLIITLLAFGLMVNEASAKRFGGGRSFGTYRSVKSFSSPYAKQPSKASSSASKWGGVVGGLLMGGLLASLFMNHGLAGGLLSWLLVGTVLFVIIGFLRKRMQPGFQSAHNFSGQAPFKTFTPDFSFNSASGTVNTPAGFMSEEFLRDAKVMFIRLQAAYDTKNLPDLSEFTSPEVLAEVKLQFQEREEEFNQTEVVTLDAELLDVSLETSPFTASVRFTGLIKENSDTASSLNEIWHFRKSPDNSKWIVSGVQQDKPL